MSRGSFLATGLALLAAAGGIALAAQASAAEIPVGSPAEILAAAKQARPGDVLVMKAGRWSDVEILFRGEGTAQRPITLRAEIPGKVVISGHSRLRIGGRYLVVEGLLFERAWHKSAVVEFRESPRALAEHCRMTGCAIVDCNPPDADLENKWVSLYGRVNRFDHCLVSGKMNLGTTFVVWLGDEPAEHQIDHNHFGPRPPQRMNGGETIRVGDSKTSLQSARCVVEANLFEECNGEAEIISNKSCDNLFRGNTFLRCAGALTLRHGNRCTVEGNFFLGQNARRTGGVRVIGEQHRVVNNYFSELTGDGSRAALSMMNGIPDSALHGYAQVRQALVAFNSFVDCRHHFVLGIVGASDASLPPEDCTLANNLVTTTKASGPLVQFVTQPVRTTWRGNLFWGAETGLPQLPGVKQLDPQLALARDSLQRPSETSPTRGAAAGDFLQLRSDIDGQPRTGKLDVGCDQASTAPVTNRPLRPGEVGPAWRVSARN